MCAGRCSLLRVILQVSALVLGAGTQRPGEVPIVGVRIRPLAETRDRNKSFDANLDQKAGIVGILIDDLSQAARQRFLIAQNGRADRGVLLIRART